MKLKGIAAVFFSPTGNTRKAVVEIADVIAHREGIAVREIDFTLPGAREEVRKFEAGELIIFGTPVYAGRIPNKILPAVQTLFEGNGALAVPVVTFGNRSFDNALIELRIELEQHWSSTVFTRSRAQPSWQSMFFQTNWQPEGRMKKICRPSAGSRKMWRRKSRVSKKDLWTGWQRFPHRLP